jgi:hypothetical protein
MGTLKTIGIVGIMISTIVWSLTSGQESLRKEAQRSNLLAIHRVNCQILNGVLVSRTECMVNGVRYGLEQTERMTRDHLRHQGINQ